MSAFRSKLSRYNTINCQQVMPVPVISIYGLSLTAPKPLCPVNLPFVLERDLVSKPTIVPMEIGEYMEHVHAAPGTIWANNSGSLPDGYLLCNGLEVSRTTYEVLFKIIGTYYGEGDGSTTFHLPNLSNTYNENVTYIIKYRL